jgi:site-specific recombinase XerD
VRESNVENAFSNDLCNITNSNPHSAIIASRLIKFLVREVRRHNLNYGTLRYIYRETKIRADLVTPRKQKKIIQLYTQDEIDCLFSVIKDPVHKLMFEILIGTGLRVAEMVSIEITNINFQANTIKVLGKGRKERLVLISNRLKDKIQIYLSNRNQRYLFVSVRKTKFGTRRIQNLFSTFKQIAGITKKGNVHQLRSQYFSKLCDKGISPEHRALLAGHDSVETQRHYVKASLGSVSTEILKKLDELGL